MQKGGKQSKEAVVEGTKYRMEERSCRSLGGAEFKEGKK